jgi:hypothetical protein
LLVCATSARLLCAVVSSMEHPVVNRTKRTVAREKTFLDVLRRTCNVTEAARTAGVGRRTAYEWRQADAAFASAWDEAEQEAADALEREAWRRGVEGTDKPVTYQGKITVTYKEYSDRMLEMLLKAHRPDKFKDRVVSEHSVDNQLASLFAAISGTAIRPRGEA